jgi:hypothetical protein
MKADAQELRRQPAEDFAFEGEVFQSPIYPIATKSTITCPICDFAKQELMPIDACQVFYECANCKTVLNPKRGDCCVFCSHGSVKCPPKQSETVPCLIQE